MKSLELNRIDSVFFYEDFREKVEVFAREEAITGIIVPVALAVDQADDGVKNRCFEILIKAEQKTRSKWYSEAKTAYTEIRRSIGKVF